MASQKATASSEAAAAAKRQRSSEHVPLFFGSRKFSLQAESLKIPSFPPRPLITFGKSKGSLCPTV